MYAYESTAIHMQLF